MAEEINKDEDMKEQFRKLVKSPPVLPVLSDHPLDEDKAFKDRFDLCYKLGPVFNIIRHKDTATPTTIAIYGDWGTGKTSAMRWLEGLIKEWNETGKGKGKTDIKTIWFYPWKYHSKDDVWRGLISEVIIKSTYIKGANRKTITKAAKQFGMFLGKGFIHALGALSLKIGDAKTTGEAGLDFAFVKDIIGEYDKNIHPEEEFLNEFEHSFEKWVTETLKTNQRMVIFIDDLDRCMPQVALRVLEALKLYLNVSKLIFVVGVDDKVVKTVVENHYMRFGLGQDKSKHYLAKMFQTEIRIGPSEKQIVEYLDYHLDNVEYIKKQFLETWQRDLFRDLINKLADRNPREVKRLINGAVISGAGAEMMKETTGKKTNYSFAQGLQVFFIRRILESEPYKKTRLLGSEIGNSFFEKWSKIVRANIEKNKEFPLYLSEMRDYQKTLKELDQIEGNSPEERNERKSKKQKAAILKKSSSEYGSILDNPKYSNLLELLADERLGKLMQIEFSAEIAEITQEAEQPASKKDDATIIKEAIAKQRKKEPSELTESDFKAIKRLDIPSRCISDISFIASLTNLTSLDISGNQIIDISVLANLTNIARLDFVNNQISDISVLANLNNIIELSLAYNDLIDISVLANLTNITELDLSNTKIIDISVLANLTNITKLELNYNSISDISSLANLTNITQLGLKSNQLSDISSLANLTNITQLWLNYNSISDISSLANLSNITTLHLSNNQLSDISSLFGLKKLQYLNIIRCDKVTDEQVKELQKALPELKIYR